MQIVQFLKGPTIHTIWQKCICILHIYIHPLFKSTTFRKTKCTRWVGKHGWGIQENNWDFSLHQKQWNLYKTLNFLKFGLIWSSFFYTNIDKKFNKWFFNISLGKDIGKRYHFWFQPKNTLLPLLSFQDGRIIIIESNSTNNRFVRNTRPLSVCFLFRTSHSHSQAGSTKKYTRFAGDDIHP